MENAVTNAVLAVFLAIANILFYILVIYAIVRLISWCKEVNRKIDDIYKKLEALSEDKNSK